jgi:hypothetical protein
MKILLLLGTVLAASAAPAEVIEGRIHAVEGNIVKFENGRVAFLDKKPLRLRKNEHVRLTIDERSSIIAVRRTAPPSMSPEGPAALLEETARAPFEPTVVDGIARARDVFDRSNPYYKRISECSDRAHVWAHDEFKATGTKALKAFVFFTASYINSVRFKWWFHVAPLYKVREGGEVRDIVMDFRYTAGPQSVKDWTDNFVYTKRPCKVTTKFSEYDVNPQTENCYLIFESMHYRLPGEIHQQELAGRYKNQTSESELRMARRLAFETVEGTP